MRPAVLASSFAAAFLLAAGMVHAQSFTISACHDDEGNTHNNNWFTGSSSRFCELRRTTLPMRNGELSVSGKNGGIEVTGEDRSDIALEARVITQASSRENAEELARQVKISTDGTIHADGPSSSGWSRSNWSVNYRLHVPRHLAAKLHTENGSIDLSHIEGSIQADTENGGLTLDDLAGDVHATTVNGGLDVTLNGHEWQGGGLYAQSTNGGVSVKAPDHYSAHLVAETVNGGISVGFPITVQGRIKNHIDTNLGQGGATVRFQTVNGGVSIDRD